MPPEISELTVFHCVVKHASYARAADELALSPSGISRIISRMEERLGARLVQRTTRKLSLTEAGATFHARTAQVLMDLSDAESFVQEAAVRPRGNLRITAPVVFAQLHVTPLLGQLLKRFPDISVDLSLTDRMVDLVEEGVDLAIRIGQLTDSRLIARRLCGNRRILVASPEYLVGRPRPTHPSQLAGHDCVLFTGFSRPREWKLIGPDGPVTVSVTGRIASNNVDTLTSAAKQGLGITFGATLSAGPALLSGELVRVLPAYEFEPTAIFAVYPSARQLSPKVRAVVDFLVTTLSDPPSWDRSLAGKVAGFPAIRASLHRAPHVSGRSTRPRTGGARTSARQGA